MSLKEFGSRLRSGYLRESEEARPLALSLAALGTFAVLLAVLMKLSELESFTPTPAAVPLSHRFIHAEDSQLLVWQLTGIKYQLAIAVCFLVRTLGLWSRKAPAALCGHAALVLAAVKLVEWVRWDFLTGETYMRELCFRSLIGATHAGGAAVALALLVQILLDSILMACVSFRALRPSSHAR